MTIEEIKEHFKSNVKTLPNDYLLKEYIDLSGGDDYGTFTTMGSFKLECLYNELESRLINCGFLTKPINN